jgi:hypothetical protein
MPKLWRSWGYGMEEREGKGHAYVFRYDKVAEKRRITWFSSWGVNVYMDYGIISAWDEGTNTHITAIHRLPAQLRLGSNIGLSSLLEGL